MKTESTSKTSLESSEKEILKSGFHIKKVIDLKAAIGDANSFIGESDLALQVNDHLLQYEYKRNDNQKSVVIKPGSYNLSKSAVGIELVPMEFIQKELLTSITNTSKILNEADFFFNNLNVYEELGQPKKRGILLYGPPGTGKSSSIIQAAKDLKLKDVGAVIINWPTSELEASNVFKFFTSYSEYSKECTKLILVIEDIGGNSHEGYSRRDEVSSSLLNLLDGINNVFKIPTLILATSNHPENLMDSLSNRPGRLDLALEIGCPSYNERVELVQFLAKRELSQEEKDSLNGSVNKGAENFSIAHMQEIVIRSRLHNKSINNVVKELIEYANLFKKDFQKPKKTGGFGFASSIDIMDD